MWRHFQSVSGEGMRKKFIFPNPVLESLRRTSQQLESPSLPLTNQNNTSIKTMKIKNSLLVTTLAAFFAGSVATAGDKDIVDTAVAAGSFKTLAAALEAGGLIEALKGEGPFTVFAPTDDAFAALPEGPVETLLKPENKDKLVDILTYHVVSGKVPAETAVTLSAATALNEKEIKLSLKDGALFLNDSKVVKTDIMTSNGVIHVIDAVLLPPSEGVQTSAVTR